MSEKNKEVLCVVVESDNGTGELIMDCEPYKTALEEFGIEPNLDESFTITFRMMSKTELENLREFDGF